MLFLVLLFLNYLLFAPCDHAKIENLSIEKTDSHFRFLPLPRKSKISYIRWRLETFRLFTARDKSTQNLDEHLYNFSKNKNGNRLQELRHIKTILENWIAQRSTYKVRSVFSLFKLAGTRREAGQKLLAIVNKEWASLPTSIAHAKAHAYKGSG